MATELDDLAERLGRVVRGHRTARGMSLAELARACGLSKTILARIESGAGNPSMETMWRVSRALRLPLGALLVEEAGPRLRVIRARSGERLNAETGMVGWLVHADGREHRSELYELELPAGMEQRSEAHLPGVEELVVCVRGRLRAGPEGAAALLGAGDAVWFAADVPHAYAAVGAARALCWMHYPPAATA